MPLASNPMPLASLAGVAGVCALLVCACAPPPVATVAREVLCPAGPCLDAIGEVDAFWGAERHHAGSSLTFASGVGDEARVDLAICVPGAWGQSVARRKAAFLAEARRRARDLSSLAAGERALPESCVPGPASRRELVVRGSGDVARSLPLETTDRAASSVVVICDRSTSAGARACTDEALRLAFDRFVEAALGAPGSRFTVVPAGRNRTQARTTIPPVEVRGATPALRLAGLLGARDSLRVDPAWPSGSALVEALHAALETPSPWAPLLAVFLLSDLRQVGVGGNFERSVPDAGAFAEAIAAAGLDRAASGEPLLAGAMVAACGLHNEPGPDARAFTSIQSQRAVDAFRAAAEAAGATSFQVAGSCADLPSLDRRGTPAVIASAGTLP